MKIKDATETALKMKTDAIAFYEEAAKKTKNPSAQKMFKGFVQNETQHMDRLQDILRDLDIKVDRVRPKDSIKTVFTDRRVEVLKKLRYLRDERDVVTIAMAFEKEAFDFYRQTAARTSSWKTKKLFMRLSEKKNEDYSLLMETHDFLDNTGHWYMYEEGGIIEG